MRTFEASSSLPFSLSLHREFFEDERGGRDPPFGKPRESYLRRSILPPHFLKRVELRMPATLLQARGVLYIRHTLPWKRCRKAANYRSLDLAKFDGGFDDAIYELIYSRIQISATLSGGT